MPGTSNECHEKTEVRIRCPGSDILKNMKQEYQPPHTAFGCLVHYLSSYCMWGSINSEVNKIKPIRVACGRSSRRSAAI